MLTKFYWGILFAVALPTLYLLVFLPDTPFAPTAATLGQGGYEPRLLTAPIATGPLLEIITFALTATRIGPFLRRTMLNANGFETMRTLAEQVGATALHLYATAAACMYNCNCFHAFTDGRAPTLFSDETSVCQPV